MTERKTPYNTGLEKVPVQCSPETFVVNQSLVHRIHIYGGNRHLRQAPNRYGQWPDDRANDKPKNLKSNSRTSKG